MGGGQNQLSLLVVLGVFFSWVWFWGFFFFFFFFFFYFTLFFFRPICLDQTTVPLFLSLFSRVFQQSLPNGVGIIGLKTNFAFPPHIFYFVYHLPVLLKFPNVQPLWLVWSFLCFSFEQNADPPFAFHYTLVIGVPVPPQPNVFEIFIPFPLWVYG